MANYGTRGSILFQSRITLWANESFADPATEVMVCKPRSEGSSENHYDSIGVVLKGRPTRRIISVQHLHQD